MSFRNVVLIGIAACITGYAFAQEPPPIKAASPAPAPAVAKASETTAPAQAAPATEAPPPVEGKLDSDAIMAAQKAGYSIRNENGETLLCRKELQTGSRVRYKTSCLTPREWQQLQSDTSQVLRSVERRRLPVNGR